MDVADAEGGNCSRQHVQNIQPMQNNRYPDRNGGIKTEAERLKGRLDTFIGWRGQKPSIQLAIAGFEYTGTSDKVKCSVCGLKLYNWVDTENAIEAHRKYSPNCSFMKTWYTPQRAQTKTDAVGSTNGPTTTQAKYSVYSDMAARLKTFQGWPSQYVHQSAEKMASEGFFYIGSADRVRCYHCGVTLRDWDEDDDPHSAHLQWSSDCSFVRHREFEMIRKSAGNTLNITWTPTADPEQSSEASTAGAAEGCVNAAESGVKEKECLPIKQDVRQEKREDLPQMKTQDVPQATGGFEISHSGSSPMVQAVVEMGFSFEIIQRAIDLRKVSGADEFPNAVALYEAVSELEKDG